MEDIFNEELDKEIFDSLDEFFKEKGIEFNDCGPVDSFEVIGEDGQVIVIDENFNLFGMPDYE